MNTNTQLGAHRKELQKEEKARKSLIKTSFQLQKVSVMVEITEYYQLTI